VVAVGGDTYLGGLDFTARLSERLRSDFENEFGVELRGDALALQRVHDAAERAKIALSKRDKTTVRLQRLIAFDDLPYHMKSEVTNDMLDRLVEPHIQRTLEITEQTLKKASWTPRDLDSILLVGGQTHMPYLKVRLRDFFGKEPNTEVSPEEAVALGAALYGRSLLDEKDETLLLDVVPISLGIGSFGGRFETLIPANSKVPVQIQRVFTTNKDYQQRVDIDIFQGESLHVADNLYLGQVRLEVAPAPRMVPRIDVSFRVDSSGILTVSVRDQKTGKREVITLDSAAQAGAPAPASA
jgi:molecular chaperone DnaK